MSWSYLETTGPAPTEEKGESGNHLRDREPYPSRLRGRSRSGPRRPGLPPITLIVLSEKELSHAKERRMTRKSEIPTTQCLRQLPRKQQNHHARESCREITLRGPTP